MDDDKDADGPVVFLTAMPLELKPFTKRLDLTLTSLGGLPAHTGTLDGRPVVAAVTGIGTALAASTTERVIAAVAPSRIVMVGIAGAVDDETPIGAVVVPERVVDAASGRSHTPARLPGRPPHGALWTTDTITTAPDLPALRADGVVALDMETSAVAAVCEREGVPWSSVRAISDRATDGSVDDAVLHLSRSDGTPDLGAALRYVLRHPGRVPTLVRLGRGSTLAATRAADAAIAAVRGDQAGRRPT